MIEGFLTDWRGRVFQLPAPLSWRMEYGLGIPCDSFQFSCPWSPGQEAEVSDAVRFTLRQDHDILFHGVVDECECSWGEEGCTLIISGRGLQALLLDNQADAADYLVVTLQDILRSYVEPLGIQLAASVALSPAYSFSVRTGSSRWQVLYQFARYHAGVTPRFDRQGRLHLSPLPSESIAPLDDSIPVTRLVFRSKRYGVLSEVKVRDSVNFTAQTVVNETFLQQGGCASRVLTMPKYTTPQALRYNGQFQLQKSAAEQRRVEVTVAIPFLGQVGELLTLTRTGWGCNGLYRILESIVTLDERGYSTRLLLGAANAVL